MNARLAALSEDLWDRGAVYETVTRWTRTEGAGFLDLPPSQVAGFAREAGRIGDPDHLLPAPAGGKETALEEWLNAVATRGDEVGPWRSASEENPLTETIPLLFRKVLEATLDNADIEENQRFFAIWLGNEPEEVKAARRLAVLREAIAALVKCHHSHRAKKGGA